jgi:hypothetical protein
MPDNFQEEDDSKQIQRFARFAVFMGYQMVFWGAISVAMGIYYNAAAKGITLFSIFLAVVGGLSWHAAYTSFSAAKEVKTFKTMESYIEFVKKTKEKK